MIHIPSSEIKQPQLHADELGFTFTWNGHFLRGIYPQSVELAKSYFESGFLTEAINKGLFPRTWVSDYENEQFGMIIEHEMISPVLYATEWNSAMLKDAALMVLDIAKLGLKYGYNMVDCHKLNVMFKDNRPVYVDLGSFIPKEEGCTGWQPYTSFLRSYYHILKMWTTGGEVLAKRMMAPGLELSDKDYYSYKSPFLRRLPKSIDLTSKVREAVCYVAVHSKKKLLGKGKMLGLIKPIVDFLKPSKSQRLDNLRNKVSRIHIVTSPCQKCAPQSDELTNIVSRYGGLFQSMTVIDNENAGYIDKLSQIEGVNSIISVCQNEKVSNAEYLSTKVQGFCSTNFRLLNNTVLVRDKFPETRLQSDIAVIPELKFFGSGYMMLHNTVIYIEHCLKYTKSKLILYASQQAEMLKELLAEKYVVEYVPIENAQNLNGGGVYHCKLIS